MTDLMTRLTEAAVAKRLLAAPAHPIHQAIRREISRSMAARMEMSSVHRSRSEKRRKSASKSERMVAMIPSSAHRESDVPVSVHQFGIEFRFPLRTTFVQMSGRAS